MTARRGDCMITEKQIEITKAVIAEESRKQAILVGRITKTQKELLRGDITVDEFKIRLAALGCSDKTISIKLEDVRRALEDFNIDMDKERT